jgi:hypothetical protein
MCIFTKRVVQIGTLSILSLLSSALWISPTNLDLDLLPSYDYVIIGGGISGLVVASRLTEDPNSTYISTNYLQITA